VDDRDLWSARAFVDAVRRLGSWQGEGPTPQSLPLVGARALTRLLRQQPAFADGRRADLQLDVFSDRWADDAGFQALRFQSAGLVVAGALAFGLADQPIDRYGEQLVLAATDIDPAAVGFRTDLFRTPYDPPSPVLPDWTIPLQELIDRACFAGVMKAILEAGRFAGSHDTSDAVGITGLSSRTVCPGAILRILGAGFGAQQPSGTKVYLPTRDGGCREVPVGAWSDTEISVTVPQTIGAGCVGFVRTGQATFSGLSEVSGAMTQCFGAVGQIWGAPFDKVRGPLVSCPPCLPGGANRIDAAGAPIVDWFRCTPDTVEPGDQPNLSWSTRNATSVSIDVMIGSNPALAVPSPALSGSLAWPPVTGTSVSRTTFRLTARNACGATVATAGFTLTRRPHLAVTRIEVVQGEQLPDNTVRLVANRRTAVRVFVESGIADGFNLGYGPGGVGGLDLSLDAYDVDTGVATSCGAPWNPNFVAKPATAANRDVLGDSANFDVPLAACMRRVQFHATVMLPAPPPTDPLQPTLPPLAFANGDTDVEFIDRRSQTVLPLLLLDPLSTATPPTMADFTGCLDGPVTMDPFPDSGFVVNPAITFALAPSESLFTTLGWERLLTKLTLMGFLFASQPVGGIRMAVAPTDVPPSFRGGMAVPRIGATVPSLIIRVGQPVTCTHELGHTYGLQHVNCGTSLPPAGPFDPSLPFTLANPAVDVVNRMLLPSATTNESMSYCFPQWPSRQHWDQIFDRIPI
jgi:hypothetical protein